MITKSMLHLKFQSLRIMTFLLYQQGVRWLVFLLHRIMMFLLCQQGVRLVVFLLHRMPRIGVGMIPFVMKVTLEQQELEHLELLVNLQRQ